VRQDRELAGGVRGERELAGVGGGERQAACFGVGSGEGKLAGRGGHEAGLDFGDRLARGPAEAEGEPGALGGFLERRDGRDCAK